MTRDEWVRRRILGGAPPEYLQRLYTAAEDAADSIEISGARGSQFFTVVKSKLAPNDIVGSALPQVASLTGKILYQRRQYDALPAGKISVQPELPGV